MAKHPRKRQKLDEDDKRNYKSGQDKVVSRRPLGTSFLADDEAEKDDEERRLESMLFGTKFVPRDVAGMGLVASDGEEEGDGEGRDEGDGQLQHLSDSDLFFIDDGAPAPIYDSDPGSIESRDEYGDVEEEGEGEGVEGVEGVEGEGDLGSRNSDSEDGSPPRSRSLAPSAGSKSTSLAPKFKSKTKPKNHAAWTDLADEPLTVSLATSNPRLRKLRDAPDEDTVSGKEYESRLRRQFERINPQPLWAAKARKAARQRRKKDVLTGDEGSGEEEDEVVLDLSNTTTGILASGRRRTGRSVVLPPEKISIERLRDANQSVQDSNYGQVRSLAFHPSEQVPVLCVGTTDRRIRLFNIDGHTSPLLQTLHVPSLPITSQTSAQFHPSGSSLLLTGPRPFFYTHDLQSGTTTRHARGLWGATFSAASDTTAALLSSFSHNSRKRSRNATSASGPGDGEGKAGGNVKNRGIGEGMEISAFSPYPGDILAVAGRGGHVHLVDWKSGAGQVITSLKCGAAGGGVKSLWWVPPTPSDSPSILGSSSLVETSSRPHLAVLSGDAEVYLWDVGQRRCVRRWKDEGGFKGAGRYMTGAVGHGGDGWLAIGSTSGFINVYGADSFSSNPELTSNPKPMKSIPNLLTPISTLRFNHDAQLLAIASQEKKDAMRLMHLPSLTSFANWPTSSTPLGHVTAVDFSARSEYIVIGNTRGRVLLYHLRDYGISGNAFLMI
ncbi:hypothetical protein AX15_007467 [Amanita polypyramis BW_CC]|nr:hypothetical protein AX15_007467 [Amanita polypyramis BW_CC]